MYGLGITPQTGDAPQVTPAGNPIVRPPIMYAMDPTLEDIMGNGGGNPVTVGDTVGSKPNWWLIGGIGLVGLYLLGKAKVL